MKVLVTGIAGEIGGLVAFELLEAGCCVCGLDRRVPANLPSTVRVHHGDWRGTFGPEVLRRERPDVVVHLASSAPSVGTTGQQRINLIATRELLSAVAKQAIPALLFVSRHLYYGAAADLPLFHREQDPPHGVETYPEAADVVAADLMVAAARWNMPSTRISILRVCHPLGESPRGLLSRLLQGSRVPTVLGFDPLVQFLHPADIARAVRLAIEQGLVDTYNVGASRPMALSHVIAGLGRSNVPIPEALFRISLGRFGLPEVPAGALSLLKYPIVVDDAAFRNRTGFVPSRDEHETLASFNAARKPRN